MKRMFRFLKADEIECRISIINDKGLSLLLYKDARVDQNILDETIGAENWQRSHELINGNLFCNVGIWFDKGNNNYEWVWKQDVGTESYTEKQKGQASDAFKRACFNWGIGRELYTAPFIWITPDKYKSSQGKNGKPTTFDQFDVKEIRYSKDGRISYLEIWNMGSNYHRCHERVFVWEQDPADAKPETRAEIMEDAEKRAEEARERADMIGSIDDLLKILSRDRAWLFEIMGKSLKRKIENVNVLTMEQLEWANRYLESLVEKAA